MSAPVSRGLRNFAVFTAFATLCLICIGGLVTSHEAGMSVPDWPTSYGYNMFFFPISQWWHTGNVFYEHSHRLFASGVGGLMIILSAWLWGRETDKKSRWIGISGIILSAVFLGVRKTPVFVGLGVCAALMIVVGIYQIRRTTGLRWLGMVAYAAVVLQGILGGLRVTLYKDEIGIFHATLAQLFFVTVSAIALFNTQWWRNLPATGAPDSKNLRKFFAATTALILVQLIIAASMRHQHAGLAIPDFPLAYGKLWPATDPESIAFYNAHRSTVFAYNPISAAQINLQMIHRIVAAAILLGVAFCAGLSRKHLRWSHPLAKLSAVWLGLICLQVFLGAATIWTEKSADIATTHVAIGALSLMTGGLLTIISFRVLSPVTQNNLAPQSSSSFISNPVGSSR